MTYLLNRKVHKIRALTREIRTLRKEFKSANTEKKTEEDMQSGVPEKEEEGKSE